MLPQKATVISLRWTKSQRLRTRTDFAQTRRGKRFREGPLTLTRFCVPSLQDQAKPDTIEKQPPAVIRLGVIITRKAMRRAHDRNRAKRIIREAVRIRYHELAKKIGAQNPQTFSENWVFVIAKIESESALITAFETLVSRLIPLPIFKVKH